MSASDRVDSQEYSASHLLLDTVWCIGVAFVNTSLLEQRGSMLIEETLFISQEDFQAGPLRATVAHTRFVESRLCREAGELHHEVSHR